MLGFQAVYNPGEQLAYLRKEKSFSQVALGKLAGTTGKYISELEHGKPAGIHVLARITVALAHDLSMPSRLWYWRG